MPVPAAMPRKRAAERRSSALASPAAPPTRTTVMPMRSFEVVRMKYVRPYGLFDVSRARTRVRCAAPVTSAATDVISLRSKPRSRSV